MNAKRSQYLRGEWGSAVHIDAGLWRVRLHHPHGGLAVNTYIIHRADALIVIDPGWPWTLDALVEALNACGIAQSLSDVTHWLYTHSHIDHMGAAAILADHSTAPHIAHSSLRAHADTWHAYQDELADWSGWVRDAFASPSRETLLSHIQYAQKHGKRRPLLELYGPRSLSEVHELEIGQTLHIGALTMHIIDLRGHDMSHIGFWVPAHGWFFVGDVLLPVPTPLSPPMHDRVDVYEATLTRCRAIGSPTWILPGHGTHLKGDRLTEAIDRSQGFVRQHREAIRAILPTLDAPIDLHTLALKLTPDHAPLTPGTRWWVHLALTDSHLKWLIQHDDVVRVQSPEGPRYWS